MEQYFVQVHDYVTALLLCIGVGGYLFGTCTASGPDHSSWPGLVLLTISIHCDAIIPNLQQQFMRQGTPLPSQSDNVDKASLPKHQPLSPAELMVNVNAIGCCGRLIYMACTGHLTVLWNTCRMHPQLAVYLTMVGMGLSTAVFAYT